LTDFTYNKGVALHSVFLLWHPSYHPQITLHPYETAPATSVDCSNKCRIGI